jgi:hypothetical protein
MSILNLGKVSKSIDDLMLDPNNPRFSKLHDELVAEDKYGDSDIQMVTLSKMLEEQEIEQLESSILSKGFVPVDNIFIKKIPGSDKKYYVVEGNRRVAAIKNLLYRQAHQTRQADVIPKEILKTLDPIMCFDLSGNSKDEIDFILGLRHHGAIKIWEPLPSSFNIYHRYITEFAGRDEINPNYVDFQYDARLAKKIANLYSLNLSEVRAKVQTYNVYLQLITLHPETLDKDIDRKFSIIGDSIKNTAIREEFGFNEITCIFSDDGVEKFVDLVFGSKDKPPVIVGAAVGKGNLRDFAYVLENGKDNYEEYIQKRIYDNRENPEDIGADIKSQRNQRNILSALEFARDELGKIKIKDITTGLAEAEKEVLVEIEAHIRKIKDAAHIK